MSHASQSKYETSQKYKKQVRKTTNFKDKIRYLLHNKYFSS